MGAIDRRERLAREEPFSWKFAGDESLLVYWSGKLVRSFAKRERSALEGLLARRADNSELQLFLARATGNFKRGNERR